MVFEEQFLADVKSSMENGKRIRVYLEENGLDFHPGEVRKALKEKYGDETIVNIVKTVILAPENVLTFKTAMKEKKQALKELRIQARSEEKLVVNGKIVDRPVRDLGGKGSGIKTGNK